MIQGLKLDLGCGARKKPGFFGIDIRNLPEVDLVSDVLIALGAIPSGTISEVRCNHFVEHLFPLTRIALANEIHRVLVPGGVWRNHTPDWRSPWAYGDLTHVWPPVVESWYAYLNYQWRTLNHIETEYTCDFTTRLQYGHLNGERFEIQAELTKQ